MLKDELSNLLNKHSRENMSDTPDFLLAEFMMDCLTSYEAVVRKRDAWFGFSPWGKKGECDAND
jgi:hypothetical protein